MIHSHLRMTGSWRVRPAGRPTPSRRLAGAAPRRPARWSSSTGPVLELMTESRTRFDQRLAGARARHPGARVRRGASSCGGCARTTRRAAIGDALLDQRTIAGHRQPVEGEGCFARRHRPVAAGRTGHDEEALAIVRELRPRMQQSAARRPPGPLAADLQPRRPAVPALRAAGADRRARPGRRQPTDVLVSELPALRRVGHKGADQIAPGNTAASFDAALAARRRHDRVRRPARGHATARTTPAAARARLRPRPVAAALTLEEGLAHLASSPFTSVELDVDLKLPGYEARVVEALRAHGLVERALVSSTFMRSLVAVRALEPRLRLGWSVPRARRDYTAVAAVDAARRTRWWRGSGGGCPPPPREHLTAGRCDAIMAHWRLVSPRAGAGGRAAPAASCTCGRSTTRRASGALEAMGVTGVITNDPRLFD